MIKKVTKVLLGLAASMVVLVGMTSCNPEDLVNNEELIAEVLSLDKKVSVNVVVDRESLSASTLHVQSLAEDVELEGSACSLQVFDNGKPQIIAVTDASNNLLMMYRGPIAAGGTIQINGESTAEALVTFDPLFGPVTNDDYSELMGIITAATAYADLQGAVNRAISRGNDLTDTANAEVLATLYNLFREVGEIAYTNQTNQKNSSKAAGDFIDCYPMQATISGNTLTLRTTGVCPSYFGTITNSDGAKVADVCVPSRASYGIMDLFSLGHSDLNLGDPYTATFTSTDNYDFHLSRINTAATIDFYTHLANNILGVLGANIDNNLISALSQQISNIGDLNQVLNGGSLADIDVMDLVGQVYDVAVDFLTDEYANVGISANWRLAGTMLKRLTTVYNVVKEATDALMRITWSVSAIREEIDFCVNYTVNEDIKSCLDVNVAIAGGNNQIGPAYQTLAQPLKVYVRTRTDNGQYTQQTQRVRFTVTSGNGTLSQTEVQTNSEGIAQTQWTLGSGNSGAEQRVTAVVVDNNGNEISNTVDFAAMVSNSRWRINLRCDWAGADNYVTSYDVDFAWADNNDVVVNLVPQSGTGWDYFDGPNERYNLTGTYNRQTNQVNLSIAMYTVADNHHFRTDSYTFVLQGNTITSIGTLTYDDGAGCVTAIDLYKLSSDAAPYTISRQHAPAPANVPVDKRTLHYANR